MSNLAKLQRVFDRLRKEAPDLYMNVFGTFIFIAQAGDTLPITSVATSLDMPLATASRHIQMLGGGNAKLKGLGWVQVTADKMDQRVKLVGLTVKGQKLTAALEGLLV